MVENILFESSSHNSIVQPENCEGLHGTYANLTSYRIESYTRAKIHYEEVEVVGLRNRQVLFRSWYSRSLFGCGNLSSIYKTTILGFGKSMAL